MAGPWESPPTEQEKASVWAAPPTATEMAHAQGPARTGPDEGHAMAIGRGITDMIPVGDKIASGVEALVRKARGQEEPLPEVYRMVLERNDRQKKQAQADHSTDFHVGQGLGLGASLAIPVSEAGEGTNLAQKAFAGAKTGLGLGAATGFGNSRADTLGGTLMDTGVGAGVGLLTGGALPVVGAGVKAAAGSIPGKLKDLAEKRAAKAMGVTLKDLRALEYKDVTPEQLGRFGLDKGLVTAGSTEDTIAQRASELAKSSGQKVGDVISELDERVNSMPPSPRGPQTIADMFPQKPAAEYDPAGGVPKSYQEKLQDLAGIAPEKPLRRAGKFATATEYESASPLSDGPGYGPPLVGQTSPALKVASAVPSQVTDQLLADPRTAQKFFVNPSQLAQRIEDELITRIDGHPAYSGVVNMLRQQVKKIQALGQKPLQLGLEGGELGPRMKDALSFKEMQKLKLGYDNFINHNVEQSPALEMMKRLRGIVNDEMERKAEALSNAVAPDLFKRLSTEKATTGMARQIEGIAADRAKRVTANRYFSPSDHGVGIAGGLGAVAAGHAGLPALALGAVGAGANKLLRERGSSVLAVGADAAARGLQRLPTTKVVQQLARTNPGRLAQAIGAPRAAVLARALREGGDQSFAATHFVMQQTDPHYQSALATLDQSAEQHQEH